QARGVVDDVLGVFNAVRKLPYVDSESIFLYGGSGGGTLALEVASVSNDLAGVVAGEPATIIYMGMFTREHVIVGADGRPSKDRRWDVMNADANELYTPELRKRTRAKLRGLDCPVLILHGDVHAIKKFNLGVFIPEMRELGKDVVVKTYPGELHGFYWGQGLDTRRALQANRDAEAFVRQHAKAAPAPVSPEALRLIDVEPMKRPDPR
ncbi:MAG: prolyl oligopeptidase family serine peptidase, partial [bacterium]|nr:prolyl oligopeptidase family serine peptidase [bacterium]